MATSSSRTLHSAHTNASHPIQYDPKIPMIWIPDEVNVWKLVQLLHVSHNSDDLTIRDLTTHEEFVISSSLTHPLDPTHLSDLNDLCGMNNLHEAPLLSILKSRFFLNKIYTNTGNVLISINPYQNIPGLYDNPLQYLSNNKNSSTNTTTATAVTAVTAAASATPTTVEFTPHVYQVANSAFNCCIHEGNLTNQSVIVSGESGAGKTEASKYVMQFLITANEKMASSSIGEDIKQVLLDSNAIFESFGNSKTVRNDNSSRFGKYIKLQYNSDDCLISAFTETFLLEKSRLSYVGLGERNYHIFYQLIRGIGASSDFSDKSPLYLERVEDFSILTSGECTILNSELEDVTEFNHLHSALATMGTTPSEMHHIWEILSIILHLGNMQCTEKDPDNTDSDHHNVQLTSPIMPFEYLSQLLGVDSNLFADRLIHHHVRITRGRRLSAVVKALSVNDVKNNILGLNKWLYSSLFNWLVKKVNHAHLSVARRPHQAKRQPGRRHSRAAELEMQQLTNITAIKFIGILDIFGFEILGKNSFEQLCINFANERLQQQFNEHVFVNEQLEYEREGLNWSTISYQDNQHVIDLISKKPSGLLIILEEYGMLNRAPDDKALLLSFHQAHDTMTQNRASVKKSVVGPPSSSSAAAATGGAAATEGPKLSAYAKPRYGGDSFIIKHFAGDVEYSIEGFLIKNNDSLQDDIMEVLMTSTNDFLKNMGEITNDPDKLGYLPELVGGIQTVLKKSSSSVGAASSTSSASSSSTGGSGSGTGSGNKKMASSSTVSLMFRSQLDELMATLRSTHPHYIKCIKPNTKKTAHVFEAPLVMQQLRYSGALEVVRIRREGFPQRCNFQEFFHPYQLLAYEKSYRMNSMKRKSQESLERDLLEKRITERKTIRLTQQQQQQQQQTQEILNNEENLNDEILKDETTLETLKSTEHEWKGRASDLALTFLPPEVYQVGYAKLFLREGAMKLLQLAMRRFLDGSAAVIQSLCRMKLTYRRYEHTRCQIISIQSHVRRYFKRKEYLHILTAIRRIQWMAVGKRLRREYQLKLQAGYLLSRRLNSFSLRLQYLKLLQQRHDATLRLQCAYRSYQARCESQRRHSSIILLQSVVRCRRCRQQYLTSLSRVVTLQSQVRRHLTQSRFHDIIKKCRLIQSVCRKMITFKQFQQTKQAILKIQTCSRRHRAMKRFQMSLRALVLIQSLCRKLISLQQKKKSYAAIIQIQKCIRRKLAIDHYNHSVRACVLIQSLCRMIYQKESYRLQKSSTVKLQSFVRKTTAMKKYSKIQQCCVLIQSVCRMMLTSHKYQLEKSSSIQIQTVIRRKLIQSRYFKMRQKCISIQAVFRRFAAMRHLTRLREYKLSTDSGVILQSFGRMILQRMKFLSLRKSVILIQTLIRRCQAEWRYKSWIAGCVKIQSLMRRYLERGRYLKLIQHCTTLQAFGRQINCRRVFLSQRHGATLIQSLVRSWLLTRQYQLIRQKIIQIQSWNRMSCHKSRYHQTRLRCIQIQAFGRQIIDRRKFLHQRSSVILLQAHIRSLLSVLSYLKLKTKAITIQSWFRSHVALREFQQTRQAAILLQCEIRKYLSRCKYQNDLHSVIIVQSLYRMLKEQRKYHNLLFRVTVFQALWRGYVERTIYWYKKDSAILIESFVRSLLLRRRYLLMKSQCQRIQVAIRAFLHNRYLQKSLDTLFHTCTTGQGRELESLLIVPSGENQQIVNGKYCAEIVPYTTFHLREVLNIRYRHLQLASILQIALSTGNLSVVKTLYPGPTDILAKDKLGNSAAHYVSLCPSVDIIEFLAESLQVRYVYSELLESGVFGKEDVTTSKSSSTSSATSPSSVPQRKLFGRRGSFMTLEDDSDDEGTSPANETVIQSFNEKIASALSGDCIRQGWLKKRRVGDRWQKRWCVLSQTGIAYYKKKGDPSPRGIIPIEGSTISRMKDPIFIINNERLLTKKHHVGKSPIMEFQADNEKDLQEWLLPLRALAGTGTGERGFRPGNEEDPFTPINYIDTDLRVAWLNEVNKEGDTPLMILCRFKNRGLDGNPIVPTARILQLAMWLSQNGCSLDAQNKQGLTALHLAIRYGNLELANCLIARGADTTIRNSEGFTVIDLSPQEFIRELPGRSIFKDMQQTPILGLNRLRGYSYLTIHFQKHSQSSTAHREDFSSLKLPFLVISVYNQKKKLIESVQHMPVPVVRRSSYVWWGSVWHMQTPLDNLEEGSYIIIELKNAATSSQILFPPASPTQATTSTFSSFFGSSSSTPDPASLSGGTSIAWYLFPLNLSTINSGGLSFELFQSPIIYPPSSSKDPTPPSSAYRSDMSFLEVSCLICKRGKDVDLEEYRTQPDWIHHHRPLPASCALLRHKDTNEMKMSSSDYGNTGLISSSLLSISKLLSLHHRHDDQNQHQMKSLPVFTEEQLSQLSIKDLKFNLGVLGVDCSIFFEKSEMREGLRKATEGIRLSDPIVKNLKYAAE